MSTEVVVAQYDRGKRTVLDRLFGPVTDDMVFDTVDHTLPGGHVLSGLSVSDKWWRDPPDGIPPFTSSEVSAQLTTLNGDVYNVTIFTEGTDNPVVVTHGDVVAPLYEYKYKGNRYCVEAVISHP